MAKGKFKCSVCDRTFSMAAHVARHMSSMHGIASKRKAGKPGRRPGRPAGGAASAVRYDAAHQNGTAQIVSAMRNYYDELCARRAALEGQMNWVEEAMQTIGRGAPVTAARGGPGRKPGRVTVMARGRAKGKGRGNRTPRAGALREYVLNVLSASPEPMGPREISGAVMKSGYNTKAKDLTKAVSNLLPKLKGLKKVGFGKYKV
jgi:hypothetical protein